MFRSGPWRGGVQKRILFLLGCVRHSSGYCDLVDRQLDFPITIFKKTQILHKIFIENSNNCKNDGKRPQRLEQVALGWAKASQKIAKVRPKGAKGSQKGAKGSEKGAKRQPRGAKREPTGDQNASKSRSSEKVAKRVPKRSPATCRDGPFWEPFSPKIRKKHHQKNIQKSTPKK